VIITKYEDEIRRVQCNSCSDVHAFRKPRGEEAEETPVEPERQSKKRVVKKPTWDEFFAKHDPGLGRPYSFRDSYIENDIVHHPKFGVGFASETMDEDKIEITFKDSRRVLVHNRKELPGAPPELARPPRPRPQPKPEKGKAARGKASSGAAAAAKAKADGKTRPDVKAKPTVKVAAAKAPAKGKATTAAKVKPVRAKAQRRDPRAPSARAAKKAHARPAARKSAKPSKRR